MQNYQTKKSKYMALACVGLFLAFCGLVFCLAGKPILEFVADPPLFRAWVKANGIWSRLAFVGMMALQIFVAFIPGEPLEIGAGYAFGPWEGTLLCLVGAVIGTVLVFFFVRRFGVKIVETFFPREKIQSLSFLNNTKKLNFWVFLVFFIPGTPKDLLCYVVALTKIKLSSWVMITFTARVPSVITSTIGGDALGLQDYGLAIWIFAITLAISGLGLLAYQRICRSKGQKEAEASQEALPPHSPPDEDS